MRAQLKDGWTLSIVRHRDFVRLPSALSVGPGAPEGACVTIPARVPGNFETDMARAGLIPDPFYGTNILGLRELEDRHLIYRTVFDAPVLGDGERPVLRFEGIDTFAEAYVNGERVLETDNMFLAREVPLPRLRPTGNELVVHVRPTMIEAQKTRLPPSAGAFAHAYAGLSVRKAPSSFGWDILPRAVSGGLWRPVYLDTVRSPAIRDVFLYAGSVEPYADPARGYAALNLFYEVDLGGDAYYPFGTPEELPYGFRLAVRGVCGTSVFEGGADLRHTSGNLFLPVRDALLWYPKNAGDPRLYDVTVTLLRGDEPVDARVFRTGVRTVTLDRARPDGQGEGGRFLLRVNRRPVFVMGTNWTPLDAFHGRDAERLPRALELLDDVGCNAVRCWGGNVYEGEDFFRFCDERGILVWQDFAMACAVYPCYEGFRNRLREEVQAVVRRLRNHPSLCLYAGDNECDLAWRGWHAIRRDPAGNLLTRQVIPETLREEDPTRPYLPSSPYLDGDDPLSEAGDPDLPENHLWGPRDYFKGDYYRNHRCRFASETGYHGCPSPASLASFIPPDELWPMFDRGTAEQPFEGVPLPSYLAHQTSMELNESNVFGYRIRLMTDQARSMFRDTPGSLAEFAMMSQASQAEALKYFVERFRAAKWDRTGIIWWNLLDGWPQVSDAVVGYDFIPKLAYFFLKRAQRPVHMAFVDPEEGRVPLYGINDSRRDELLSYTVRDVTDLPEGADPSAAPPLASGRVAVPSDSAALAGSLPARGLEDRFLYIEWTDSAGERAASHFVLDPRGLSARAYLRALALCGFADFYGF